jgi:tetratricopeptide (TPR) repeat protein
MAVFGLFKKKAVKPEDVDYILAAEELEKKGDFGGAIQEYEKMIQTLFSNKEPKYYRHITRKILNCYIKAGNYEKIMELWPSQYDSEDYGGKEMHELIKILETAQRMDLVAKVYDSSGNKLTGNKIEFLIKQKKIPEANALLTDLLSGVSESNPAILGLWMTKAKLCLSLRKWEEANKYLTKIIEKNPHNEEARKLKEFCFKQVRSS